MDFDHFLEELGLSDEDYMKAVQSSVKVQKVFLKRKPIENRINPIYERSVRSMEGKS